MRIIAIIFLLGGCSYFATQSPAALPAAPDCSVSSGPPVLDSVIGMGAVLGSTGFAISSSLASTEEKKQERVTTAGLLLLTSLVVLPSALLGGFRVRKCRNAWHEYELVKQQQQQQPQPYYPPPYYPPPYYPPQPPQQPVN